MMFWLLMAPASGAAITLAGTVEAVSVVLFCARAPEAKLANNSAEKKAFFMDASVS
jgi:hypothetical protein